MNDQKEKFKKNLVPHGTIIQKIGIIIFFVCTMKYLKGKETILWTIIKLLPMIFLD
jgi:hypothetical protein